MKKIKLTALLLAIVLAFSCLTPMMSFAAESEDAAEETYSVIPYMLKTQSVDGNSNKVNVWLELNPTIAEGVAAYQINLQLENKEGMAVAGRKMSLEFDSALDAAKVKEAKFDETAQTMKIYVAGTTNLVKTSIDEDGNIENKLPIGTATVETLSNKSENSFKIVLSGKTGNLKTVGLDCVVNDAAEVYGEKFEIPVDGTIFAVPDYSFTVGTSGEGTVKAYKVNNDGTETLLENNTAKENTVIRLDIAPASGSCIAKVMVTDKATGKKVAVDDNYSFNLSGDLDVAVVFEKIDEPTKPSCSCGCHKSGIAKFFWSIGNFFNKLFKIESKRYCCDGETSHW